MIRSIPPNTSTGCNPGNRKSGIPKISLNLGTANFGSIKSSRTRNPDSKSFKIKKGKKMPLHQYQRMGVKTLEELLIRAEKKKEEMTWAVQILSSDENLENLDKLEFMIRRLKHQIESRR